MNERFGRAKQWVRSRRNPIIAQHPQSGLWAAFDRRTRMQVTGLHTTADGAREEYIALLASEICCRMDSIADGMYDRHLDKAYDVSL